MKSLETGGDGRAERVLINSSVTTTSAKVGVLAMEQKEVLVGLAAVSEMHEPSLAVAVRMRLSCSSSVSRPRKLV